MVLKVYNDMGKKVEEFKPIEKDKVRMYVCGPTVYNNIHIGNARSFVNFDIIKRYLKFRGYEVKHVQNITDVGHLTSDGDEGEDKLIKQARKEGLDPYKIAEHYTQAYFYVLEQLRVQKADVNPKATEHIKDIIEYDQKLIDAGNAYVVNGSVYFDVSTFKGYGKLSGNTLEKLQEGASKRVVKTEEKRRPQDFALWKKAPENHLMKWDSPWGVGYPGWHIECSVMAMKYLGDQIDIHGGGKDLIFPHHENEIAQTEVLTHKAFSNYWLHNEFVLIDGEKMSKSKGNFYTAQELIDKYGSVAIRYYLLSSHYRTEINITENGLNAAVKAVNKLQNFWEWINEDFEAKTNENDDVVLQLCNNFETKFMDKMDDDFNTPAALGEVFEFIKKVRKIDLSDYGAGLVRDIIGKIDLVLDVFKGDKKEISGDIKRLIEERELARKNKDWAKSDEIRDKLKGMGILLEDTKNGVKWKMI